MKDLMYQIPSHLGGNQQQHDAEGDFEFSGGQLVRRFYAEWSRRGMVATLNMATAGR